MKTARDFAVLMYGRGIISEENIDNVEEYFLDYMEGFRLQLIKDIKGEQSPYFMVSESNEGSVTMNNQTTACVIELIVEPTEPEEVKESIWFNYKQFEDLLKICQRLCLK